MGFEKYVENISKIKKGDEVPFVQKV